MELYTVLLAPNASMMTGPGTNTLVLGEPASGALVIDPADANPQHLDAIQQAAEERGGVARILLTHSHPDHIGGAVELRERTGAALYGFRRETMPFLDHEIADGTTFSTGSDTLRALYTPGHCADHLCFYLEKGRVLFAGDVVAGVGTVVIEDLFEYMETLHRLQALDMNEMVPSHGPVIQNAQAKLAEYIAHRMEREQQIIAALDQGEATVMELVRRVYTDVRESLYPVAAFSVSAHLKKLEREQRAICQDDRWRLKGRE
uniref:MBL fold metallo-hydrolase n=1 Tax=Thermosporothrix sp. COM3 TaxID=2490863 RepID=A0A455SPQ3_9CHLR|nr:MBL fold metallo-hydrolase [Thermosporothrix sp. COM3]